jgi:hypothetical protein
MFTKYRITLPSGFGVEHNNSGNITEAVEYVANKYRMAGCVLKARRSDEPEETEQEFRIERVEILRAVPVKKE